MTDTSDITDIAAKIRGYSWNDDTFVRNVYRYVIRNIRHVNNPGWTVKTPDRAFREKTGDCSERALLIEMMLKSQGIDAHVVHGLTVPTTLGLLHDTVEVRVGKYSKMIDACDYPDFVKMGDGLHPRETIVE